MKTQIPQAVKDFLSKNGTLGGHARAKKLSAKRRAEIAREAGIASGKARRRNGQKHRKLS